MSQIQNVGVALYGERLAVALGFATLVSAIVTFISCRSCLSFLSRLGLKNFTETKWYRVFFKYHGYAWPVFLFFLTLHLLTALMHTAIPTAGDPDAAIHWIILSFASGSFFFVGAVLFSCRSLVNTINLFTGKNLVSNKIYLPFYRYHSFYWIILIAAIVGHFIAAYVHVGLWPT